ncbi:MAG: DNA primase [Chloroflexi bacterium]|nr:MAG: DNA primase [Chloroflexota bacterium]
MSAIDEIKARVDILDLVSESVQLRRTGKNYIGFCPFHPNSRTPAFVVFADSGTWRCFGQCNEGGDIFKFVMKKEGWDFSQALHILAERAGVVLTPVTPEKQAEEDEHERLRGLLEEAVTFFRHHLMQTPAGQGAYTYLQKRGLKPAIIETFGLGYAPESWDSLIRYFTSKGYPATELLQVGLVTERQGNGAASGSSGIYDKFRHRIMFPIRDGVGRMVGFGGRILNPEDQPKFMNSPQTALFDKGRLLYAMDQARKAIRAKDQVVIVEGYLDVIALHQAGFNNVVSPMGTALTEDQLRMLKRLTRRIVLALDPDAAGQKATLRGLEVARQAMDHTSEIAFDARGLLRNEARLEADLRVTTLPEGQDPDEIVNRDPQEWARIIEAARPIVVHVMETLATGRDLDDPKVKSEIAAQVLPLVEDVPNAVEREAYRQRLARLLRVDERSLLGAKPRANPVRRRTAGPAAPRTEPAPPAIQTGSRPESALEIHCLRLLLRQPDSLYLLDRVLQKAGLSRLSVQDFEQVDHQMLAAVILQSLEQDDLDSNQFILENLSDPLQDLVRDLLSPFQQGEPTPEKLVEDLIQTVMRLRQIRTRAHVEQLIFMQRDGQQEEGNLRLDDYQGIHQVMLQCSRVLKNLDKILGQPVQLD